MKNLKKLGLTLAVAGALATPALAQAPLDMDAAGSSIAGFVGGAALAGVAVFIAIMGVRVIKKAFSTGAR